MPIVDATAALLRSVTGGGTRESYGDGDMMAGAREMMISVFLVYLLFLVFLFFFGTTLWNHYLVNMFTCLQPIESAWSLVALSIFVKLIF